MKTTELQGEALDRAVAHCVEWSKKFPIFTDGEPMSKGNYSTDWALAGPIIEREWLDVTPWPNESREDMRWHCQQHDTANDFAQYGPTLLIAAMRCFVASKMGDDVEIPEELI
jgi:hypothetical protein